MIRVSNKVLFDVKIVKLFYFVLIGIFAVSIDYLFYSFLIYLSYSISLAKGIGFLFGTNFSFYFNKKFTFRSNFTRLKFFKYFLLYVFTLNLNIQINSYFIELLNDFQFATQMAFFIATGFCSLINFLGLNYFIFKKKKQYNDY